jgi:multiple sugar transport system permease protein
MAEITVRADPVVRSTDGRPATGIRYRGLRRTQAIEGMLCIAPWFIGFVVFTAIPMVSAFGIALTKWDIIGNPEFVGLANFQKMANDRIFYKSLSNTFLISFSAVPLNLTVALVLALALNQKVRGVNLYRTVYFLPSQMPLVASSLLWLWIFNPDFGLANILLAMVGLPPLKWLFDPDLARPTIVLITLWGGVGTAMMVFLAGLQGIPQSLYEASAIDGASRVRQFQHVTLPMLSPVIFFNLIIGIISSFQAYFTLIYNTTRGGPANETLIYIIFIFFKAFQDFEMGYATALSLVLFVVVLVLTGIQFLLARRWVYYEGGDRA